MARSGHRHHAGHGHRSRFGRLVRSGCLWAASPGRGADWQSGPRSSKIPTASPEPQSTEGARGRPQHSPPRGSSVDIEAVIASALGIAAASVDDTLEFRIVPEWDSAAHLRLVLALQEALGVAIDDELAIELTSVPAIRAFASKNGDSRPSIGRTVDHCVVGSCELPRSSGSDPVWSSRVIHSRIGRLKKPPVAGRPSCSSAGRLGPSGSVCSPIEAKSHTSGRWRRSFRERHSYL